MFNAITNTSSTSIIKDALPSFKDIYPLKDIFLLAYRALDEMDQTEHQELLEGGRVVRDKYQLLRRILQFLVTGLSLFSLFLCFYMGFSLFPKSFCVYFNARLLSLLTHTLERKYMFLICNGILAFLAKSSISCTSSSSRFDLVDQLSPMKPTVADIASIQEVALSAKAEEADKEEEEVEEAAPAAANHEQELQEQERETLRKGEGEDLTVEDEGNEEERGGGLVWKNEEDDQEEEEENEEVASTEELNRKFEEFIRKMKEEIRVEAYQQLIAV